MPDDVDDAVEPAQRRLRLVEQSLGVGPGGRVTRPGHATDLLGDLAGEPGVDVDAEHLRPHRAEGVGGLAADPLAGADQHESAAVEAQETGIVGNRGVVDARHAPAKLTVPGRQGNAGTGPAPAPPVVCAP